MSFFRQRHINRTKDFFESLDPSVISLLKEKTTISQEGRRCKMHSIHLFMN